MSRQRIIKDVYAGLTMSDKICYQTCWEPPGKTGGLAHATSRESFDDRHPALARRRTDPPWSGRLSTHVREVEMSFPLGLKIVGTTALFAVGLALHGDWKDSVYRLYTSNCGFFPCGRQSYPYALAQLANGNVSIQGFKELLLCRPDPDSSLLPSLSRKRGASESPTTNRNGLAGGLASPKIPVGSQ